MQQKEEIQQRLRLCLICVFLCAYSVFQCERFGWRRPRDYNQRSHMSETVYAYQEHMNTQHTPMQALCGSDTQCYKLNGCCVIALCLLV